MFHFVFGLTPRDVAKGGRGGGSFHSLYMFIMIHPQVIFSSQASNLLTLDHLSESKLISHLASEDVLGEMFVYTLVTVINTRVSNEKLSSMELINNE